MTEFERMLNLLIEQNNEYYEGIAAALKDDFPIDELKEIERKISQYA